MKVVFGTFFREKLRATIDFYTAVSPRLGADFDARVRTAVRTIARWQGGDHVGPHGFPCRCCRPFPHLLYYAIEGETLYVLGLVHEHRHPDYLKRQLSR